MAFTHLFYFILRMKKSWLIIIHQITKPTYFIPLPLAQLKFFFSLFSPTTCIIISSCIFKNFQHAMMFYIFFTFLLRVYIRKWKIEILRAVSWESEKTRVKEEKYKNESTRWCEYEVRCVIIKALYIFNEKLKIFFSIMSTWMTSKNMFKKKTQKVHS